MVPFAIISKGGKQYKVSKDKVIKIEKIAGNIGDEVHFTDTEILMVGDLNGSIIGTPSVPNASVTGRIIDHSRDPKVLVFKKKRRQNYRRLKGHKQHRTHIQILEISRG